jgi:hypothetical protein
MPRASGQQYRSPIARIQHDVVHDMAEEGRPRELPGAPSVVRPQEKRPLTGSDQEYEAGSEIWGPMAGRM